MSEQKPSKPLGRHNTGRKHGARAVRGPVLIVDDNPDDAKLAQRAFERVNPHSTVTTVASSPELVKYLEELDSSKSAASVPALILLDLKMPEMDGFAILEWMAKRPQLASIPVIVLSTFDDLHHVRQAYTLGARSYLLKPINTEPLRDALQSLNIAL
jgi:two-component system response regulator